VVVDLNSTFLQNYRGNCTEFIDKELVAISRARNDTTKQQANAVVVGSARNHIESKSHANNVYAGNANFVEMCVSQAKELGDTIQTLEGKIHEQKQLLIDMESELTRLRADERDLIREQNECENKLAAMNDADYRQQQPNSPNNDNNSNNSTKVVEQLRAQLAFFKRQFEMKIDATALSIVECTDAKFSTTQNNKLTLLNETSQCNNDKDIEKGLLNLFVC
jgi:predicted RNase H-like nuclease (RuvC/YqgF family)